jgi:hypothetical protein
MSYCLNPDCARATSNPIGAKFCQSCGSKLLLQGRYRALQLIGQGGFGRTFLAVDEDQPAKPRCVIKQFFPQAQVWQTDKKRQNSLNKKPCAWKSWANILKFPNW